MLSVLELKLEMEVSSWSTSMSGTAIAKVEQSTVMKGEEWQHEARLLYVVWVALKLCPETPGCVCMIEPDTRVQFI